MQHGVVLILKISTFLKHANVGIYLLLRKDVVLASHL
jgi:hypothetical protein